MNYRMIGRIIGQILGLEALFLLPPLLLCSLATGAFTGGVSAMLVRRIPAPLRAD